MNKDPIKQRNSKKKKRLAIAIVIAAALAVGAVGAYSWLYGFSSKSNVITITDTRTEAEKSADDLWRPALEGGDSPEQAAAAKELEILAKESESRDDKITYLSSLVTLHQNLGQFDEAMKFAEDLESLTRSGNSAALIAGVYFEAGNYNEASKYYQLAADRSDPVDDPKLDSPYNDYMNRKREAEANIK